MSRYRIAAAVIAVFAALPISAQMGGGYGTGPGMMGSRTTGTAESAGCPAMPGMMGGMGMMGAMGMMGGLGPREYAGLKLDEAQRSKIEAIQKDFRAKRFAIMENMYAARLDEEKRIDEVLTPEQREERYRAWRR